LKHEKQKRPSLLHTPPDQVLFLYGKQTISQVSWAAAGAAVKTAAATMETREASTQFFTEVTS